MSLDFTSERAPTPTNKSTLYPKITGKLPDILDAINKHRLHNSSIVDRPFPFVGAVKLHGTHADILVHPDGRVVCQSRNRTELTASGNNTDNLGFAAFCLKRENQIRQLAKELRRKWWERHGSDAKLEDGPIMLAGEWIGTGVQRGVAIAALSRRFVICSIQINDVWEPIEQYSDIADEGASLFNISSGGFYHLNLSWTDGGAAFMIEAERVTMEVGAQCPFGRAQSVQGAGEGIVWTPAEDSDLPNTADFWLKTKTEHFAVTKGLPKKSAEQVAEQADMKARAETFAAATCTEMRMEQSWDYLREMGFQRSMKGMGHFSSWVVRDIEFEERREIEAMKLGNVWKGGVGRVAKPWYEGKVRESGLVVAEGLSTM